MHALSFFKISPGGNPTLLMAAEGLSHEQQALVAEEVLHPLHLCAEQAGFVDLQTPSLRMAGGEFCINATRALALLLALEQRLTPADDTPAPEQGGLRRWRGTARTSGMPDPVELHVTHSAAGYDATVLVPLSALPPCETPEPGFTLVRLPGITHLLVDAQRTPFPAHWEAASAGLRRRFGLEHCDAAGCIWWRQQDGLLHADPVVAVRHPYTICRESSCGSGALALALALNQTAGGAPGEITVMQPSGLPLRVELETETGGMRARVGGPVRLLARGEVFVEALQARAGRNILLPCG